jgi:hypothetical protein
VGNAVPKRLKCSPPHHHRLFHLLQAHDKKTLASLLAGCYGRLAGAGRGSVSDSVSLLQPAQLSIAKPKDLLAVLSPGMIGYWVQLIGCLELDVCTAADDCGRDSCTSNLASWQAEPGDG